MLQIQNEISSHPRDPYLLKCPFCGEKPLAKRGQNGAIVCCASVDCHVHPQVSAETEFKAAMGWNRRLR